MTRGGKLLWVAGGAALLGLLVLGALSSGRVQTKIAQTILADQPGIEITLRSLDVGWSDLTVRDLEIKQGPLLVKIPGLRAELPIWRLLGSQKRIDRLEAQGWEVRWDGDVVELAAAPAPQIAAAGWGSVFAVLETSDAVQSAAFWEQLTQWLNQPLPLSLGEVDLQGRAFWRQAGPGADGYGEVRLSGSGPVAGELRQLLIEVDATGVQANARGIQSLSIVNRIETKLTADQRIDQLKLDTQFVASLSDDGSSRAYGLELNLVQEAGSPRLGFALREGELPLISAQLGATEAGTQLGGDWSVSLNATNLSHLMLGREFPTFSVDGHGEVSASQSLVDAALNGTFTFVVTDVGSHFSQVSGIGDLSGEIGFAMQQSGPDTRFTRLDVALAGAAPVLEARLLQGVEIGRDAFELRVANPAEPLCEIELEGLPPAWIQPLLAPWVLDARPVQGKLMGLVSPQGLRVVTNQPIRMERVALAEAGQTWIDDGLVEVDMGAEVTPDGWQIELGRVEISRNGSPVVTLQARGGKVQNEETTVKAVGRVEADLVGLTGWPGLAESIELTSGRLTAEFGLGLEDRISIATAITMDDLAGADAAPLPTIEMDGRVDLLADGRIEIHLPSKLVRDGRSSELTFNLRAETDQELIRFESSLSSPVLHIQDLQDFANILPGEEAGMVMTPTISRDLSPVQATAPAAQWAGLSGTLQVSLGKIVVTDAPPIERLSAEISSKPEGIEISNVEATIGEQGTLNASGRLRFDAAAAEPYLGTAQLNLSDIAIEPWLRWFEPGELPVLTGRMNLEAAWEGAAVDPAALAETGILQAQVRSGGGVIRALGVQVDNYIETGQTVAALGAFFGAVTGDERLQQHSQRIQSATAAAELLTAIAFDQMSLNVDRLPSGDIVISDLSLISPNLRLLGDGRITYRLGLPFWVQPLELNLSLSARDELGSALQQLGLLNAEADNLGYLPLVSGFTLDGSLANIGTEELQQLIVQALR